MPTELYQQHQEYCDDRQKVKCEENGVDYTLNNNQRRDIAKIKVDGGVFTSSCGHKKCDFMLVICDDLTGILVELKGTDVMQAISQIDETLTHMKDELKKYCISKIHARIASRSIKHTVNVSQKKRKFEKKLKDDFQGTLKCKNSPFNDFL